MTPARLPLFGQNLRAASELSDRHERVVFWLSCDGLTLSVCEKADGASVSSAVLLCGSSEDLLRCCHLSRRSRLLSPHRCRPAYQWSDVPPYALPERQTGSSSHRPASRYVPA